MILDIIIIALALLVLFIGYKVGFIRIFLKIFSIVGGLILAITLTSGVTDMLIKAGASDGLNNKIYTNIVENEKYQAYCDAETGNLDINKALEALGIPKIIANVLSNNINEEVNMQELALKISTTITKIIFTIITFIALLILFTLLIWIIKLIFKGLREKSRLINFTDGLLGSIVALAIFTIILFIVLSIFSLFINGDNGFATWLQTNIHPDDDKFGVTKYLYNHNFIKNFFDLIF